MRCFRESLEKRGKGPTSVLDLTRIHAQCDPGATAQEFENFMESFSVVFVDGVRSIEVKKKP
jgi:hypothetical protein